MRLICCRGRVRRRSMIGRYVLRCSVSNLRLMGVYIYSPERLYEGAMTGAVSAMSFSFATRLSKFCRRTIWTTGMTLVAPVLQAFSERRQSTGELEPTLFSHVRPRLGSIARQTLNHPRHLPQRLQRALLQSPACPAKNLPHGLECS